MLFRITNVSSQCVDLAKVLKKSCSTPELAPSPTRDRLVLALGSLEALEGCQCVRPTPYEAVQGAIAGLSRFHVLKHESKTCPETIRFQYLDCGRAPVFSRDNRSANHAARKFFCARVVNDV